jgi:hypothetical protein
MALEYRADQPSGHQFGQQVDSLTKLTDLGSGLPGSHDVPIVEWLQQPSVDAFERLFGMICLSYIDDSSKAGRTSRMAVMMLLSYKTVEGRDVAFPKGFSPAKLQTSGLFKSFSGRAPSFCVSLAIECSHIGGSGLMS